MDLRGVPPGAVKTADCGYMTIKKKLIISTLFSVGLCLVIVMTGWLGNRYILGETNKVRQFEKVSMYLQMVFRGINESILTEGTPYSVKLAQKGLDGFERHYEALKRDLGDGKLAAEVVDRIEPRWVFIKREVQPFLRLNAVSPEDDEAMERYGRLLAEGELLSRDISALAEKAQKNADSLAKSAQIVIAVTVMAILLAMFSLHYNLFRSIAMPVKRLRELMADVSSEQDFTRGLNEKITTISKDFDRSKEGVRSDVEDISTLVGAFDSMLRTIHTYIGELKRVEGELEKLATVDKLTQAYNRMKFDEIISKEMERARRYKDPLCLVAFDIDRFKEVNDAYGHQAGDSVLKAIADIVRANIRETDYLVRWGGEEFIILAPETEIERGEVLAHRIRGVIESFRFDKIGRMTVSFGVTQYKPDDVEDTFIKRADDALYMAKERGRNRVEVLT